MISALVKLLKKKVLVGQNRKIIKNIKETLRKWIISIATGKLGLKINFLTRKEVFGNSEKYNVLKFGSKESIVVSEPYQVLDELPHAISIFSGATFTLEEPFVFEVPNAKLVGSMAIGFDQEGSLISETTNGAPPDSALLTKIPTRNLISTNLPSFETPQLDTVHSLVNPWSNGYFHWIIDCLTRLEGAEYYQQQTGRKPLLLIDVNPPKWKIESLRLLGYEPDECIPWNGSSVKVKRLVVPSFRRERSIISPSACRWLRQRMLNNLPDVDSKNLSFSSRIYISRTKKVGRNVINKDEVLEALKPFGFVAYTLENMNFSDQVRLFSQAEIVVGPHGAGLTNTIFAQNLIVIELFGSYSNVGFFVIAKGLGFQYGCLGPVGNKARNQSQKYNSMSVDVPKLQALVAEMLHIYSDRQPRESVA
jgi:capsular polysaccharide biosynthesis protein